MAAVLSRTSLPAARRGNYQERVSHEHEVEDATGQPGRPRRVAARVLRGAGWQVRPQPRRLRGSGRVEARQGLREGSPQEGGKGPDRKKHTSELQSLMRISYAVFCLKKKTSQEHTENQQS